MRRSSVNFRGARHFCPKIMYQKLTKCPNFAWYLPEKKLTKFPNFAWFLPENARIYMIIARKICFSEFLGGLPPSATPICACPCVRHRLCVIICSLTCLYFSPSIKTWESACVLLSVVLPVRSMNSKKNLKSSVTTWRRLRSLNKRLTKHLYTLPAVTQITRIQLVLLDLVLCQWCPRQDWDPNKNYKMHKNCNNIQLMT